MILPDAEARRRALTEHDSDMLVEASAGTGKTAVIAGRAALLLASGVPPESIAAITFAEAAAAELAARIREFTEALAGGCIPQELWSALPTGVVNPIQKAHATRALHDIDRLSATTIHGFCRSIVTAHTVEAGVDPGAVVMDGDEAYAMFERVLAAWLGRRLSTGGDVSDHDPIAVLALEDPAQAVDTLRTLARFRRANLNARPATSDLSVKVANLLGAVERFARWLESAPPEEATAKLVVMFRDLADWYQERMHDSLSFRELWTLSRPPPSGLFRPEEAQIIGYTVRTWSWAEAGGAAEARRLRQEAAVLYAACVMAHTDLVAGIGSALLAMLCGELDELLADYAQTKKDAATLDFDDLLSHAERLLRQHAEVRHAVSHRYRHVLVDEVQDTDALQVSVLLLITGSDGSPERPKVVLFLVGDPKQAIYRFRGADPASYGILRGAILARNPDGFVELTANFRSLSAITEFATRSFGPRLQDGSRSKPISFSMRADPQHGYPSVVRLDVEAGRSNRADNMRRAEALQVAELCADLIDRPLPVGSEGTVRNIRPSDIALLSPAHTNLWRWERALVEAGVPVAPLAGRSLLQRQESYDFLALVRTLAYPRDTVAFGALLRGPLVGLTDAELLGIVGSLPKRSDGRSAELSSAIDPSAVSHPVLTCLLTVLRDVRRASARLTPEALLVEAVERLRMRAALALRSWDRGAGAQANLDALIRRARPFAVRGLAAFAAELQAKWAEVQVNRFRDWPEGRCDDGDDAITLCTVHSAKGLEWPVVIVVNSVARSSPPEKFLHRRSDGTLHGSHPRMSSSGHVEARMEELREERNERLRLWYVACTRARDLLILPRLPHISDQSWAGLGSLRLAELPRLELERRLPWSAREPPRENEQTGAVFAAEAENVANSSAPIAWRRPSADDPDRRRESPAVVANPDPLTAFEAAGAGRLRGAIIHKLIEETLTKELPATNEAAHQRAAELLEQLAPGIEDDAKPDPRECASSALNALTLVDGSGVRGRLIPEWAIHATASDGVLVSGRVDAVVLGFDGKVQVVFDWKTDLNPDAVTREAYVLQMRDYLGATGATRGAIVYVTRSDVTWVDNAG